MLEVEHERVTPCCARQADTGENQERGGTELSKKEEEERAGADGAKWE